MKAKKSDFRNPKPSEVKKGTVFYRMHFKCYSDMMKGICHVTKHKIDTSYLSTKEDLETYREGVTSLIKNNLLFIKK